MPKHEAPTIEIDLDELDAALDELDEAVQSEVQRATQGLTALRNLIRDIKEGIET